MEEEIFVSGRMNHLIDPQLNIWHWEIPLYLFLGGMAAGILCIAAVYFIRGRENDYRTAVRIAPFLAPVLLVIGLIALFFDLRRSERFFIEVILLDRVFKKLSNISLLTDHLYGK